MDKDWDWKEFGIEYDEGAEDIDEPLDGLNGDGEIFVLGLTDTPADSETLLPASSQYKSAANAAFCAFRFMEIWQQMLDHLYLL